MNNHINNVWKELVEKIVLNGNKSKPRGLEIREILANQSCIDMKHPVLSVKSRKLGYRFMCREAWWIINGRNDVASIKNYSKAISRFSNDNVYFDGAYGPRIVDQLRYVVDALYNDTDTRQAVLEIWRPNPRDSKDIPCTINIQWLIRENKIYCIDTMRSSDIWLGWPYDVFNFTMLTGYIMLLLRERGLDNLELGNLYLNAGSQHLYSSNDQQVVNMLRTVEDQFETIEFNPYEFETPGELLLHLELASDGIIDLKRSHFLSEVVIHE